MVTEAEGNTHAPSYDRRWVVERLKTTTVQDGAQP